MYYVYSSESSIAYDAIGEKEHSIINMHEKASHAVRHLLHSRIAHKSCE